MSCNGKCYFCQEDKCKLSKKCLFGRCFSYMQKIDHSLNFKEHLEYMMNTKRFYISLVISIISLAISFFLLMVKVFNPSVNKQINDSKKVECKNGVKNSLKVII